MNAYVESLDDPVRIIAALLRDVFETHEAVYNRSAYESDINFVTLVVRELGVNCLTEALPTYGKAFDKALAGTQPFPDSIVVGELPVAGLDRPLPITWAGRGGPSFLEAFIGRVLDVEGNLLPAPCALSVGIVRQVCYLFYKYELPYDAVKEQRVIAQFEKTENELTVSDARLEEIRTRVMGIPVSDPLRLGKEPEHVVRRARVYLQKLFSSFNPLDIYPRHGPGAVATRQKLWEKFQWTNVCKRITDVYGFAEYFCASFGAICDRYRSFSKIGEEDLPARVILVPKDSRGPRLISCEPVDFQWVQQGLGEAIVKLVESHPISRWNVNFTNQEPNQFGALLGSVSGKYVTLDLNEASDRVSLQLVRLLFPEHLLRYLEACRSTATVLPDGRVIPLRKFAPMGSCLCFPILALSIWAILTAAAPDQYTKDRILVYGDDVIVLKEFSEDAITILETFGLKVNRDKSCTSGFFRESCGVDAFKGVNVTPIRLRTVWTSTRSPSSYCSWISYANSFYDRKYWNVYNLIVEALHHLYGAIPGNDMKLSCPSLRSVLSENEPKRVRTNRNLQKREWYVWDVKTHRVTYELDGWSMLLRWFSEKVGRPLLFGRDTNTMPELSPVRCSGVRSYTQRSMSKLIKRWR